MARHDSAAAAMTFGVRPPLNWRAKRIVEAWPSVCLILSTTEMPAGLTYRWTISPSVNDAMHNPKGEDLRVRN